MADLHVSVSRSIPQDCRVVVAVRVRPFSNATEPGEGLATCVPAAPTSPCDSRLLREGLLVTDPLPMVQGAGGGAATAAPARHSFRFNHVFWSMMPHQQQGIPTATQRTVFDTLGPPLLQHVFEGFNSTLFAYGQTGSGKTHSMVGSTDAFRGGASLVAAVGEEDGMGVIPRLCVELFRTVAEHGDADAKFAVACSFAEIYCERVRDLLITPDASNAQSLKVRQHPIMGPYVEGLTVHSANDAAGIVQLLEKGMALRATAETKLNDQSSRSHAIFTIALTKVTLRADSSAGGLEQGIVTTTRSSKVNLVDLAGSERISQSGAAGERLEEAKNINLSLHTLGRVITALADRAATQANHAAGTATRPPYRESVLTWLLSDSLGGNSKTAMLATVAPSRVALTQTLNTLRFASLALNIVNTVAAAEDRSDAEVIAELRDRVARLAAQVEKSEASKALQYKAQAATREAEAAAAKVRELDALVTTLRGEQARHAAERDRLTTALDIASKAASEKGAVEQKLDHATRQHARELARREAENARLNNAILSLQRELMDERDLRLHIVKHASLLKSDEDVAAVVASATEMLRRRLEEADAEVASLRVSLVEAQAKAEAAERGRDAANGEMLMQENRCHELEAQLSSAIDRLLSGADGATPSDVEARSTTAPESALANQLAKMRAANIEAAQNQVKLTSKIGRLDEIVEQTTSDNNHAMRQLLEAEEGMQRLWIESRFQTALMASVSHWAAVAARAASVLGIERVGMREREERHALGARQADDKIELVAATWSFFFGTLAAEVTEARENEDFWMSQAAASSAQMHEAEAGLAATSTAEARLQREYDILATQFNALQLEMERIVAERDSLLDVLAAESARLTDDLEQAIAQASRADAESQRWTERAAAKDARIQHLQTELDTIQTRVITGEVSNSSALESLRESLTGELLDLKAALLDANDRAAASDIARDDAVRQLHAASASTAVAEGVARELRAELERRVAAIAAITKEHALDASILQQEIARLRREVHIARDDAAEEIRGIEAACDATIRDRDDERDKMHTEISVLRRKLSDCETQAVGHHADMCDLRMKLKHLETEVRSAMLDKERLQALCDAMTVECQEQAATIAELETAVALAEQASRRGLSQSSHAILSPRLLDSRGPYSGAFSPDDSSMFGGHDRNHTPYERGDTPYHITPTPAMPGGAAWSSPAQQSHHQHQRSLSRSIDGGPMSPTSLQFYGNSRRLRATIERQRREAFMIHQDMKRESIAAVQRSVSRIAADRAHTLPTVGPITATPIASRTLHFNSQSATRPSAPAGRPHGLPLASTSPLPAKRNSESPLSLPVDGSESGGGDGGAVMLSAAAAAPLDSMTPLRNVGYDTIMFHSPLPLPPVIAAAGSLASPALWHPKVRRANVTSSGMLGFVVAPSAAATHVAMQRLSPVHDDPTADH